jgi:hypothetical protein
MRCATGWIRQCLREHPDIFMPRKEPHFFDRNYDKGIKWYQKTYFKTVANEKVIGEKTATYLHTQDAPKRIKGMNQDMKLVCSIRDPVERLISHFTMTTQSSNINLENISPNTEYVKRSLYFHQLQWYLEHFPFENIQIIIYEEKDENPEKFIQNIYRFLEVDDQYHPTSARIQTKQGRTEHLNSGWSRISKIMLHPKSPILLKKLYTSIRPNQQITLSEEEYTQLAQNFKEDILSLENLIGRPLNQWRSRKLTLS